MSHEVIENVEVSKNETRAIRFAEDFNAKYQRLEKIESNLIEIVRKVVALNEKVNAMGDGKKDKVLKTFKANVDADTSVINKYIKVARSDFINGNQEVLPSKVSVLIKIAQSDAEEMQKLLDAGKLTSSTTLKELQELIQESKQDGMCESQEDEETDVTESGEVAEKALPFSPFSFSPECTDEQYHEVREALEGLKKNRVAIELIEQLFAESATSSEVA